MSGGSRRRRRRVQAPGSRVVVGVGAALALSALLAQLTGGAAGGAPARAAASTQPVRSTELACPGAVVGGEDADSEVELFAGAAKAGDKARGVATLSDLGAEKGHRARLTAPGRAGVRAAADDVPAQVARGMDALAPGLGAEQVTAVRTGPAAGLAATPCPVAGTGAWFVGASTTAGRRDRLVLTNPDRTQALVDLRFFAGSGQLEVPNSTGVAVGPQSAQSIPLDGIVAGHDRLVVAVRATRGRVAAAVHDHRTQGVQPRGIDWIAAAADPARTVVIPGLPAGSLGRTLQVLAPGRRDATVQVRLLAADRDFAPTGVDTLDLRAGQVADFDLAAAGDQAVTVVLRADRPIVAGVRLTRSADGRADVAYATAAAPLTEPATVAAGRGGRAGATSLLLAAPEEAATVSVLPVTGDGPGRARTVRIAAGRTVTVDPRPGGAAEYSVVVSPRPGSGPVYGARVLSRGDTDLTTTPLAPGVYTVAVPAVVADLRAVTTGTDEADTDPAETGPAED